MNNINLYRDIILIYCPPKVGSTSLVTSLRICASDKFMVFHTHHETIFKFADGKTKDLTVTDILKNINIIGDNLLRECEFPFTLSILLINSLYNTKRFILNI